MKFKARAYRPKMKPGQMNKTEMAYRDHLELLKKAGDILDYSFECETLKIGPDCRYTPDFRVIKLDKCDDVHEDKFYPSGVEFIEFHEVKGTVRKKNTFGTKPGITLTTKPFVEDDALAKIKMASAIHPYKFILVWKGLNGNWEKREIN